MDVPCYSARFVEPFAQVLSTHECYSVRALARLRAIDPATRIPAAVANDWTVRQVERTGDADLGLKAGRSMLLGRAGALDYAMNSARTVRKSIAVARRYRRLFSDLLDIHCEVEGRRATVHVHGGPAAPEAVQDFAMSAWFTNHLREPLGDISRVECWFSHPRPPDTTEYERTFAPASLRFNAPRYAFSFDREYLDAPLASADAVLHVVLCEYAALSFRRLTERSLAGEVRDFAGQELTRGRPTMYSVARELRMSSRTLGRKLEQEGTTFTVVLDHLRRERALRYVGIDEMGWPEIALRLGFSHVEAFYRAFKRWTGQTPLNYRRARGLANDRSFSTFGGY